MAAILRKLIFFFISYIFSGYILSSLHFLVEMFAIHFNNRAKLVTEKILPMIKNVRLPYLFAPVYSDSKFLTE